MEQNTYKKPILYGSEPLASENLNLRHFHTRDAQMLSALTQDTSVSEYFAFPTVDVNGAISMISSWRIRYRDNDFMHWCIALAENDICIGLIDAMPDETTSSAELSYIIHSEYRTRGYATEVVNEVTRYLHDTCGIHRITAEVDSTNIASTKVLEHNGYELEGIHIDARVDRSNFFRDIALFAHISQLPA